MNLEEIKEELLNLAENDLNDYDRVKEAYNLGLKTAMKNIKLKSKIVSSPGVGYTTYFNKEVIDKNSIKKFIIKELEL